MDEREARPEKQPDRPVEVVGEQPVPEAGQADPAHPHDNPARLGAPLPPNQSAYPPPYHMTYPLPPPSATAYGTYAAPYPPPARRRHRGRLIAAGTALAVVAAAGGLGFALGRSHHDATAGGPGAFAGPGQGAQSGGGFGSPFGGQGGGGSQPFGGSPFSGPGGRNGSPFNSSNGDPATTDQLTGLVRVQATLKYSGGEAAGTGMILTSSGEVITNHHVVEGATTIQVKVMSTGKTYRADVVGTDAKDDVAVLQLRNASGLSTVTTDSGGISVGDDVTAVGDAGGSPSTFTAAKGAVTSTSKNITTHSEGSHEAERLKGLIEISSDVISGDSGGATYDAQGEVVGMTTAASSGPGDIVGYAIPIAKVLQIADDLENGTVNARYEYGSPAFLGIGLQGDDTTVGGVYSGTPAADAGLAAGDTVTRVGGTRVRTATQLRRAVTSHSPGDQVPIAWTDTSGTTHVATVTLMAGPIA